MYRVLITSEVEKTRLTKREHKVIGQEQAADGESLIDTYGWPDQVEERVVIEIKVLEQVVEEIDLPAVIAAVNGLKLA